PLKSAPHRCLVAVLLLGLAERPAAEARSLTAKLHRFFDTKGFPTSGEFVETVTPLVERLALRGLDFPVTATSPGFTYRFNFDLGVPEPSTESFGPVFVERPESVGWHRIDLGVAYLSADLTDFDGRSFGRQIITRANAPDLPIVNASFRGE